MGFEVELGLGALLAVPDWSGKNLFLPSITAAFLSPVSLFPGPKRVLSF
jgi:hypothetical protein